jgi:hypothetical protein
VGDSPDSGLRLHTGFYREINDLLGFTRMPLFTFLSGIVYAYRPFQNDIHKFISKKVRRLLIPMLVVGTAFAVVQANIGGANSTTQNWYLLHVIPVAHFWFIESIFIIFIFMIPFELLNAFNKKLSFFGIFLFSSIIYLSDFEFVYFSVSGAIYLLPFFLLGMAVQRYNVSDCMPKYIGWILTFIVIGLLSSTIINVVPVNEKRSIFGLVLGGLFCFALLFLKMENNILSHIGFFSYSIYLYHVFFTAGTRIALEYIDIINVDLLFSLSLILGIIGPIIVELVCNGSNFTRLFFLGKKKAPYNELWISKHLLRDNVR